MTDRLRPMPRTPLLAFALLLAALAPTPRAQSDAQLATLRALVEAFHGPDFPALAALTDFDGRAAERLARGLDDVAWGELDELERLGRQQAVLRDWAASGRGFNQRATFAGAELLADPDHGHGPVPERAIVRLHLRHQTSGEYREVLVTLAPDQRVLDLEQGQPFHPGANPAGDAGLLPVAVFTAPAPDSVTWPDDQDLDERDDVTALVDELLAATPGDELALARERLHRNPQPAVAALVERLAALEAAPQPDADAQTRLVETLEAITGRDTPWLAAPAPGMSPASWRDMNHATVLAWLRWQVANGWTFSATDIVDPIEPTLHERQAPEPLPEMDRWTERLARQLEAANAPPGSAPAAAPAGPAALPGDQPAAPVTPAPPTTPPPPAVPVVRPPGPRDILFPAAAGLELRHRGRSLSGREVESLLAPEQREALNAWGETAQRLGLALVIAERPEHMVLGFKAGKPLDEAARWLDATAERLAPVIPVLEPRQARTVVALVFDLEDSRSPAWGQLLDDLVERQLLLEQTAETLRADPAGLLRRQAAFFLQPTWDMAGNAASGDDEFRFGNELVGKFAQCLATSRCGELPPTILWGLGYLAEIAEFDSVYQFNTTGFVATGDHFDWRTRTAQHVEKLRKHKDSSLGALAARDDDAGRAIQSQMVTWGALAYLAEEQPGALDGLLRALAALQAEVDRRGRASVWRGDADRTREALQAGLDAIDLKDLETWLKRD